MTESIKLQRSLFQTLDNISYQYRGYFTKNDVDEILGNQEILETLRTVVDEKLKTIENMIENPPHNKVNITTLYYELTMIHSVLNGGLQK